MSVGYATVRLWSADGVGQAGECIRANNRQLERAADAMAQQTFPTGWAGRGATAAAITRNRLAHFLEIQIRIREQFARRLFEAENDVFAIERAIARLDAEATAQEFAIDNDGTITDEHDYGFPTLDDIAVYFQRRGMLEDLAAKRDHILAMADDVDGRLRSAAETAQDNTDPAPEIGLPNQEVQDRWATLTADEREDVLRNMAADLAEQYGVSQYSITFGSLGPNTIGSHDPQTHEITINTAYLDDPVVLNTIVHEMMHAGHDNGLDGFPGLTPSDIEELRDNEDNYRPSRDDWEDYRYQPEEDITRREADEYVEGLTTEEIEDYL